MWKVGDKLRHRFNPEIGPGRVTAVAGRSLEVLFPKSGDTLTFAAASDAIVPFEMPPGLAARLEPDGEEVRIAARDGTSYRLADGRVVPGLDLWPLEAADSPVERLALGEVDTLAAFSNRLDALHLKSLREAEGLGPFLGGRIRIFPHQLYVAERASARDPVRWLLADEVGLGKTVEACLILNRLARTGRAERILIVAPASLTVQWLGELYRKFHQVFVLLDDRRLQDVEREFGAGFNPFDAHPRAIVSLESLIAEPGLGRRAAEAGYDFLVIDEAHRLERVAGLRLHGAPGASAGRAHGAEGSPAYRAVLPLVQAVPNVLLLTGTPLESDAEGFFHLLRLLRPDEFPESLDVVSRLASGAPLPPCTSATRRADIGGLPPRVAIPVEIAETGGVQAWVTLLAIEERVRRGPQDTPPDRRRKLERYRRALSSAAALSAVLAPDETLARAEASEAEAADPRVLWLARQAPLWREAGEKTLVFVAHQESLWSLKKSLERSNAQRIGVFHEDLSPERADIEVAQFRLPAGPGLLIATECGGEGRNFQFCKRLVLFDLPWNPVTVEQRIGRLDRIDRTIPVEVVYFRAPAGLCAAVARFYERLGLLEAPLSGVEAALEGFEEAIEEAALGENPGDLDPPAFAAVLASANEVRTRIQMAAYHELHRDPYRTELAEPILRRIPEDLEETNAEVVLAACEEFGFHVIPQRGEAVHAIEFGSAATIDHLPGVPGGSNFLGTFDREEAVERENIDFFAAGHALVEGVLQELEEGPRGRTALLQISASGVEPGAGLLALYSVKGDLVAITIDEEGRDRPEWARLLTARPLRSQRVTAETWTSEPDWADRIRALGAMLPRPEPPDAVAAFRIVRPA